MVVLVYVAIVLLFAWILYRVIEWIVSLFEKKKTDYPIYTGNTSKELVFQILKDLNCQPKEKDDRILFSYQNQQFYIISYHAHLIDIVSHLGYLDLNSSSEEEILKLKETVNECNVSYHFPVLVYVMDKEDKTLDVYGRLSTIFSKEIVDLKTLFVRYLDSFFEAKITSMEQFQLKVKEKEESKRVIVKGFSPVEENEDKLEKENE